MIDLFTRSAHYIARVGHMAGPSGPSGPINSVSPLALYITIEVIKINACFIIIAQTKATIFYMK